MTVITLNKAGQKLPYYTQNLKDLANSIKPLCPADISPMRGDFGKLRTKKASPFRGGGSRKADGGVFKKSRFFKYCR